MVRSPLVLFGTKLLSAVVSQITSMDSRHFADQNVSYRLIVHMTRLVFKKDAEIP